MTDPLVTIAITSYNYARTVGDAVASALAQTYRNLDVVVLDNASTDDSVAVVHAIRDERLRVVEHPENVGMRRNHNLAIREARGEFVMFLSADDMLLPCAVRDAIDFHRAHPEIDMAYFSVSMADTDGNVGGYFDHPSHDGAEYYQDRNELANLLTRDNCMYMPTMLFPRALFEELGELDERLNILLDYELDIRMAAAGKRFAFVSKPEAIIRMHGDNRSGVKKFVGSGNQLRDFCAILRQYVVPANFDLLAGYKIELLRMLEGKVREMSVPFPAEFAALANELVPLVEATHVAIDQVPDRTVASDRGEALISVVIPFAGRSGELDRALRSLRAQTYANWEAIVSCDGSYDPSGFIQRLGLADRVRVSRLRRSRGPSGVRNLALHGVRGEIVAYLDDDNRYEPGYLAAVAAAFADPSVQITVGRSRFGVLGPGGDVLLQSEPTNGLRGGVLGRISNAVALNAVAHRRSILAVTGYFNESYGVLEDWEFLMRSTRSQAVKPLDIDACVLGLEAPLLRHHVFGRRSSPHWTEYAQRVQDLYNAYPARTPEEGAAREAFFGTLQATINAGVAAGGRPEQVLAFAQALTGSSANGTA